jgi:XTP/dITP diphosphohydrolase
VHGDDQANNAKLLKELENIPEEKRGAHFTCAAALVLTDGKEHVSEEIFEGSILYAPLGDQGFGYDPLFRPQGFSISSAQMSAEEKDLISHRGKSLRAIAPHVIGLLTSLG